MLKLKRLPVFIVDSVLIAGSFLLSFLIRFDFHIPVPMWEAAASLLPLVLFLKVAVFISAGIYRNLWRYASLQDGFTIFKVVFLSSIIMFCVTKFIPNFPFLPRSILLLDFFLLLFAVASSRIGWRMYREMYLLPKLSKGRRTLIVGAGQAGSLLLKEIRQQPFSPYNVVGCVDDDAFKVGLALHGVSVLGKTSQLKALIRKHKVEKVIIAIPSAPRKVIGDIIKNCENAHVKFKIVPGLTDILSGKVSVSQVKDVEIEDLLGRDPVSLDEGAISGYLSQKVVLITGAGGSIGSEICRQVAKFRPGKVILLDAAETPLYYIEKELVAAYPDLRMVPVIGDVRHVERVEAVFNDFQPDVVFHAAAYKHVPMMEYNPVEAVTNNIGGTKNVADAADRHHVQNFVMISTDKAVNPTNVMGASKRAAEIYVQALSRRSRTKFTTVRFGNVLGSNGSVIPLFKEQIRKGGPLTVTDPKVIRYFMTIPEATQLVLQAGCIGDGGEIFVLDMGEPVRIVELAEQLIRLSGFAPYDEIDITFTGLRPGEKLFEELLISGEDIKPTAHQKIKVLAALSNSLNDVCRQLDVMFAAAKASDVEAILNTLNGLVPEFVHQNKNHVQHLRENVKKGSGAVIQFPKFTVGQ